MKITEVRQLPWYIAGVCAVSGVLATFWFLDRFVTHQFAQQKFIYKESHDLLTKDEFTREVKEIKQAMYSMQLKRARESVMWWENRSDFPNLNTGDRLMYEEQVAMVSYYRSKLLELGDGNE